MFDVMNQVSEKPQKTLSHTTPIAFNSNLFRLVLVAKALPLNWLFRNII